MKVSAWRLALEEIPSPRLLDLVKKEIQNRTSEFMPVPADILRRWKGDDSDVVVANATAYQPLAPTENELIFKGELPALPESGDGRAAWEACRERLSAEANQRQQKFISDNDLLTTLHLQCEMTSRLDATPQQRKAMLIFGRWLIEQEPNTKGWHGTMAKSYWSQWQQSQTQQSPSEVKA